jgi:hypothetical protein
MNPHTSDDPSVSSPGPALKLLKFRRVRRRRKRWHECRPETNEAQWVSVWETFNRLKELAPWTIKELTRIVERVIPRLEAGDGDI